MAALNNNEALYKIKQASRLLSIWSPWWLDFLNKVEFDFGDNYKMITGLSSMIFPTSTEFLSDATSMEVAVQLEFALQQASRRMDIRSQEMKYSYPNVDEGLIGLATSLEINSDMYHKFESITQYKWERLAKLSLDESYIDAFGAGEKPSLPEDAWTYQHFDFPEELKAESYLKLLIELDDKRENEWLNSQEEEEDWVQENRENNNEQESTPDSDGNDSNSSLDKREDQNPDSELGQDYLGRKTPDNKEEPTVDSQDSNTSLSSEGSPQQPGDDAEDGDKNGSTPPSEGLEDSSDELPQDDSSTPENGSVSSKNSGFEGLEESVYPEGAEPYKEEEGSSQNKENSSKNSQEGGENLAEKSEEQQLSQQSSQEPSQEPSQQSSQEPSQQASQEPSQGASQEPSQGASQEPSQGASQQAKNLSNHHADTQEGKENLQDTNSHSSTDNKLGNKENDIDPTPQEEEQDGSSTPSNIPNTNSPDNSDYTPLSKDLMDSSDSVGRHEMSIPKRPKNTDKIGVDASEMENIAKELAEDIKEYMDSQKRGSGGSGGYGVGQGYIEWSQKKLHKPKASWKKIFPKMLTSNMGKSLMSGVSDMTYAKRNPNQKENMPLMMGFVTYPPHAAVLIDASPSMYPDREKVISEFTSIAAHFFMRYGDPISIFVADNKIQFATRTVTVSKRVLNHATRTYMGGSNYGHNKGDGFGGTMEKVLKGKAKYRGSGFPKPGILVVFTDGEFEWPYPNHAKLPQGIGKVIIVCTRSFESLKNDPSINLPKWVKNKINFVSV